LIKNQDQCFENTMKIEPFLSPKRSKNQRAVRKKRIKQPSGANFIKTIPQHAVQFGDTDKSMPDRYLKKLRNYFNF